MRYEAILDIEQKLSAIQYKNPIAWLHFHQSLEIHYVVKGKILIHSGDQEKVVEPGELFFIPSYFPHSVQTIEEAVVEVLIIPSKYFQRIKNEDAKLYYSLLNNKEANLEIYQTLLKVKECLSDQAPSLLRRGYIYTIFGLIFKHYQEEIQPYSTQQELIKEIINYIEEHYREDITLDLLAELFHFNKHYFSRLFNKVFGCNLRTYINGVRATHVILDESLNESHETMTQRIYNAGFKDISTFYKYKKRFYGF